MQDRTPGKKLIERDPVLDLAAFYAARGITPEQIRQMSYADRAVLQSRAGALVRGYDKPDCGRRLLAHTPTAEEGRNSG